MSVIFGTVGGGLSSVAWGDITGPISAQSDLNTALNIRSSWVKYTVTYTDLSTAATSNNITLFTASAKELILGVVIKHSTAFSGGSISAYTLSLGVTGDLTKFATAFDVFQSVSETNYQSSVLSKMTAFGSTTAVKVAATSTSANLSAATAGSADIWVESVVLP